MGLARYRVYGLEGGVKICMRRIQIQIRQTYPSVPAAVVATGSTWPGLPTEGADSGINPCESCVDAAWPPSLPSDARFCARRCGGKGEGGQLIIMGTPSIYNGSGCPERRDGAIDKPQRQTYIGAAVTAVDAGDRHDCCRRDEDGCEASPPPSPSPSPCCC